MGFSPYDDGGPVYVGEQENAGDRKGDAIVDELQNVLGVDKSVNTYDLTSWDLLMSSIDDMTSSELIKWIGEHPDLSSANASTLDSLLQQKFNRENYDYEYEKNRQMQLDEREYNSYKNVMARMKEAGINPALAFRTGENQVSFSSPSHGKVSSNLSSQFAREASLAETSKRNDTSAILGAVGAIVGIIGLLIAL